MKSVSEKIQELRKKVNNQISLVKEMGFLKAIKADENGYDEFRKIYETHGDYIHPYGIENLSKDEILERKNLYREMSYESEELFKKMLEEHYLKDVSIDKETKDYLYLHSYNLGHSSGYSEINNYYMEIVEDYKSLPIDSLMEKLDI